MPISLFLTIPSLVRIRSCGFSRLNPPFTRDDDTRSVVDPQCIDAEFRSSQPVSHLKLLFDSLEMRYCAVGSEWDANLSFEVRVNFLFSNFSASHDGVDLTSLVHTRPKILFEPLLAAMVHVWDLSQFLNNSAMRC